MSKAADGLPEKGDDIQRHDRREREAISQEPKSDQSSAISVVVEHTGANNEPEANEIASALPFSKGRCIAIVLTVAGASFINTLSGQAVIIVLPTIGRELDIPETRLQWIVSAYNLSFGCFLLLWGRIADIYGKRKIFILGSAWVVITTAINPFLHNEIAFDLFRGLQGLGAAANVPTAIGILGTTFPPGKAKNYAFSCYAAGAPLGAIFGTLMSGFIAQYTSWKWVFGVIAIMAAAITIAGIAIIPPPKHTLHEDGVTVKASVDWIGAILVTVGLFALLFALTEGNVVGWKTPWVPVLIVISLALVVLFVLWQRYIEKKGHRPPLMKVSVFKSTKFSAAMLIMALSFSSFSGFLVYATYFIQDYQGHTPLQTTLQFLPTGIVGLITAAVVSQLVSRVQTYILLAFGNLGVSLASLLFAIPVPSDTTYWAIGFPAMVISVFGADTAWPCLILFTSHSLPQEDQALGGALVNAMGQVGRAIGLAVATAIQTGVMASERGVKIEEAGPVLLWDHATLMGIRAANWWHFALGLAALSVVLIAFRGSGIIGKAGVKKVEEREKALESA